MTAERNEAYRRARLRKTMDEARLDGFLIVDPLNVSYLTGFRGEDSYFWLGDVGAVLLSDTRFEEQIKEEAPDLDALIRRSGETTLGLLDGAVANAAYSSRRPKRVGIEAASTTVSLFNALREKFPDVEFVPRANDVERLREIKDASEIAAIRAAVDVTIDGFRALKSAILPDATEVDLR
ncbi:MAG: aminopeptidase P family N-terminal domain-containing protein, partial [Thermoguttaceae bacterium]|nr:aminopeptidase P family N-terminal domain-containing protein [Thermoguttaceae bacterium]